MELRGTLRDFSLEAILGLSRNGHKTGTLRLVVTTPVGMPRQVDLSFLDGEIASVQSGSLRGLDALREAAICVEGSFEFSVDSAGLPQDETVPVAMDVARASFLLPSTSVDRQASPSSTSTSGRARPSPNGHERYLPSDPRFRLWLVLRRQARSLPDCVR